jgi:hypothetical protein
MGAISSKEGDSAKQEEIKINPDRNCVPSATAESGHPKDQINKDYETTLPLGFKIISSLKKKVESFSATDDQKTQHVGYVFM